MRHLLLCYSAFGLVPLQQLHEQYEQLGHLKAFSALVGNASSAISFASKIDTSSCPPVAVASMLLEHVPQRIRIFEMNSREVNMTKLRAVNGSNHTAFLDNWRWSGVRMKPQHYRGWLRSYGAVSATLSHITALRWQVRNRVPFLLRMEDDILIRNGSLLRGVNCILSIFLKSSPKRSSQNEDFASNFSSPKRPFPILDRVDTIHFHFGPGPIGVGADAYLTSLAGARAQLHSICERGIYDGFDFMTNHKKKYLSVLHLPRSTTLTLLKRANAPSGKGSVLVKQLNHFDLHALENESVSWPLDHCLHWAGLS